MTGPAGGGSQDQDGEGQRRYLIAAAVSRYPKCPAWDRPGLVEAREQIVELFTQKLGYRHHTALGTDPTVQQLREQLRAFCTSKERRDDDLVVVYLSGHGELDDTGSEHMLLMADTDPTDVAFTSLPTAELFRVFSGTRVRRMLLILDTCYSGQGGNELAAAALERLSASWAQGATSPGLVIMSSAQAHQQAQAGLFPHLLREAVNSRATAGHAPKYLSVSAVVQQMNDHDDKPAYQHISLSLLGLTGEPPDFFTNPRHNVRLTEVDLALQDAAEFDAHARQRETEFNSRLLVRAMGSYYGKFARGWWFCGRHRALAELTSWLSNGSKSGQDGPFAAPALPGGEYVRVVTAGPGSGKTAVLGLLAALTMPDRRRTVPVDAIGLKPKMIPGEGSFDVVMYAQNLTDTQVLSGLAAAAGLKCATVGKFLEGLEQRHSDRERPFTVLLDALDEAATPDTLCSQIVRPLIEHSKGRIRLLLGTRPYLLDRLNIKAGDQRRVLNLDNPRYADRQALVGYTIRNLLESHSTSPYRSADPRILRQVAEAVAIAAGTSFLVARFAAYTLAAADKAVPDPRDPQWRASLPRHADEAMRDDLTRRLGPDAQRVADLLRPLAYAEGQGLPWEGIWAPLASAISGRSYTDDDLLWLRRNAGSYVVEATENGRSAYRLYHQALTEHLREGISPAAIHNACVDILTSCVPYRGDATRDWSRAHPYTLNHLATHAAAAARVDDVLKDAGYLVYAVPRSLTPHLREASSSTARLTAAVYEMSLDLHVTPPAPMHRKLLAFNAARADATELRKQLNNQAGEGEWVPMWATGIDLLPDLRHTLTEVDGQALAVACALLGDRPIAVVGTSTGGVYVLDMATGQRIGDPIHDLGGPVLAVACALLGDRPIAVVGTNTGGVYVLDMATGQRIGDPIHDLGGPVLAVACALLDDRPIAVVGTNTGGVYVLDVTTGQRIGDPIHDLGGPVFAVACALLDDRPIAVTVTGGVYVLDVTTGQRIGDPIHDFDGSVLAVACALLDDRPIAVIGTGTGGVYVVDVTTGQRIGDLITNPHGLVNTVGCTILDGQPVVVIGTRGEDLRVVDLRTLKLLERFLVPGLRRVSVARDGTILVFLGRDTAVLQRHSYGHSNR